MSSAETSIAYGLLKLPNLNDYSTIKIGKISLESGTFAYVTLYNSNETAIYNFVLSNSVQSLDISEYNGEGYFILVHARDMNRYSNLTLENIEMY